MPGPRAKPVPIHLLIFFVQIIVGDCIKAVEQYIKEGRKFDYVFGDLTDVTLSESPTGELT